MLKKDLKIFVLVALTFPRDFICYLIMSLSSIKSFSFLEVIYSFHFWRILVCFVLKHFNPVKLVRASSLTLSCVKEEIVVIVFLIIWTYFFIFVDFSFSHFKLQPFSVISCILECWTINWWSILSFSYKYHLYKFLELSKIWQIPDEDWRV